MNYQHTFTGRKPSKAQVMRTIGNMLDNGNVRDISIHWGENWIDLMQQSNGIWCGTGWIKDISGDDIAKELNEVRKEAQAFIKEHFIFVHIK